MSEPDPHPLSPEPAPVAEPVRTHLGWAVAVSALCFLPLGLVAVVYSLRAARAVELGDADRGRRLGRVAGRWILGTAVVGVLLDLLLLAVFALLGAASS